MSPLQALILDRMAERGWEPKTVEDRGVSHATLHRYMNPIQLSQLPRRSVREALAKALDLDFEVVTQAAKDSVDWSGDDTVYRVTVEQVGVHDQPMSRSEILARTRRTLTDALKLDEESADRIVRTIEDAMLAQEAREQADLPMAARRGRSRGRAVRRAQDEAAERPDE